RRFKRELVLRPAHAILGGQVLHRLHVERDPFDPGEALPQPTHHFFRARTLRMRLRLIRMRPLFNVVLEPSTPMNEDRLSTAGSSSIARASARCRSAIAENEMDCGASDTPWMTPVSCSGKKPFGTTM